MVVGVLATKEAKESVAMALNLLTHINLFIAFYRFVISNILTIIQTLHILWSDVSILHKVPQLQSFNISVTMT